MAHHAPCGCPAPSDENDNLVLNILTAILALPGLLLGIGFGYVTNAWF